MTEGYYTADQARSIIKKAKNKIFRVSIMTVQVTPEDHDKYYTGIGSIRVSRRELLDKIFHETEGKYNYFAKVVDGKALVRIRDLKMILFIG